MGTISRSSTSPAEPAAKPPTMTVEATISAHRYIESRNTGAVLFGSKT